MVNDDGRRKLKEHKGNNIVIMTEWKRCKNKNITQKSMAEWKM